MVVVIELLHDAEVVVFHLTALGLDDRPNSATVASRTIGGSGAIAPTRGCVACGQAAMGTLPAAPFTLLGFGVVLIPHLAHYDYLSRRADTAT